MMYIMNKFTGRPTFALIRHSTAPMDLRIAHLLLCSVLLMVSCRKEDENGPSPPAPLTSVQLRIEHHVDNVALEYDTMAYTNEAGELYSVSHLEYYLSVIILHGINGTPNDTLHGPYYVNGSAHTLHELGKMDAGEYSGASLVLGIPPSMNTTGALPNTLENINMAWPDPMGGGYHFLKFEGHYVDGGNEFGFAMHAGGNSLQAQAFLDQPFVLDGGAGRLLIRFNLNELLRTPTTYAFSSGNYSMGDVVLMGRLRDNAADAFTISYLP